MNALTPQARAELSPEQLAATADNQLTVEVAEAALHELHAKLERIITDADSVRTLISVLAGPSPSFLPQHLMTMINMGTGYFRHDKAVLEALFRRRNAMANPPPVAAERTDYAWKGRA